MNYTELTANIQDVTEQTFTAAQLAMFTQQAEQKIYNTVQFPSLRKTASVNTADGNDLVTIPTDLLWNYSAAVVIESVTTFLLTKDVNFIREAYPNSTVKGVPKHYAFYSDTQFILGPTPNAIIPIELHYGYYPTSIVTAGTTWLGTNFDIALLNGALIEAIRFIKGEADMVELYEKHYLHAITLLKNAVDGKQRQDSYRFGQVHDVVS
tara:strand:+ start:351 stop:977 length:627 start_codon:yes stop_codon:yes gene_type:complete